MKEQRKFLFWINRHLETRELVDTLVSHAENLLRGHDVVICEDEKCAENEVRDADAMFAYRITPKMIENARKLKWVQFGSAGIDHTLSPELLTSDITITTFSGVHPIPLSEHVFSLMLALSRHIHTAIKQQMKHLWDRSTIAGCAGELHGKTIGIVGLGKIGLEIAKLAKAFDMTVIGTKARPVESLPNVDKIYLARDLDKVLTASDFLVLVVPLTSMTSCLLSQREIDMLKPGAFLINVARGQMVDQEAMIKALNSGHLAGAGLDVFATEPLSEDSPLWDTPNVIVTPHTGGSTPEYGIRGAEIFNRNLKAFLSGGKMVNVFDRSRGY